jgi:hypothetical protein
MRTLLFAGPACVVIACGLAIADAARAGTVPNTVAAIDYSTGAVCQLSIPTTDTRFRPKASGARNDSTTASNFVICPLPSSASSSTDVFTYATIAVYSIDGASHDVTCTAVTGRNGDDIVYSGKTFTVTSDDEGQGAVIAWSAADFGGTEGDPIPGSRAFSVTCLLPPQTAVNTIQGAFEYAVGA